VIRTELRIARLRSRFFVAKAGFQLHIISMEVQKVKYALWAHNWEECVDFYATLFNGEVTLRMEVWSEVEVANGIIGIHGGGDKKERQWTGLSFQVDDLRAAIVQLKEVGGDLTSEPVDTEEDPLHLAMCIDPAGNEFMMTQKRQR